MSEASSSGSGFNPGRHIINDATGKNRREALKRAARRAMRRNETEGSDATSDSGRTFASYASSSKSKPTIGAKSTTDASSVFGSGFSSYHRPKESSRRSRFPNIPHPEPSTQPSAKSTCIPEGHEKSSSSCSGTEFNHHHETAGKPQASQPSTESTAGGKAMNESRPFSLSSEPKSSHEAVDKPFSSRASDCKPTYQSSSAAQASSTKDSLPQPPKAAQQDKSNRAERDKTSQPSRSTPPEDPPNSPPQHNAPKQSNPTQPSRPEHNQWSPLFKTPLPGKPSDKIPPSSPQQEDTATCSQDPPRVWKDFRRNALETLRSLALKLEAPGRHISTGFWVLVSLLAPFVERASDVFRDALALVFWICKMSVSTFDRLIPKIVIHACMVVFVSIGIILFILSFMAGFLKDRYCDVITAMHYNIIPSSATDICLTSSSQRSFASSSLLSDTLQGFQARIPSVWRYLENTLDSVNRDLVVARHPDLLLNMEAFRPMYVEGLQESEVLERHFMRQQRALWFNVNHFISNIPPGRPEQHWILDLLGFVNTALIREARDTHQELIEILDNSREQTMTFQRKLSEDPSDVLTPFVKLFNPKTNEFREKLTQMIMTKAASDPHKDDPDDILGSSALWGASSDVVLDMLFHRHGMLVEDIAWLSEKLVELKISLAMLNGRSNVSKEVWEKQADELMEKAWAIASEWRGKLKGYFVVYD